MQILFPLTLYPAFMALSLKGNPRARRHIPHSSWRVLKHIEKSEVAMLKLARDMESPSCSDDDGDPSPFTENARSLPLRDERRDHAAEIAAEKASVRFKPYHDLDDKQGRLILGLSRVMGPILLAFCLGMICWLLFRSIIGIPSPV